MGKINSKPNRTDNMLARIIIGAFVLGLLALIVWYAVDLSGILPQDDAVLP